ncbi:CheB methylesterase domain-containing protein [Yoonia sp. SS1-5]|uniref:protein-glutamate methylesterase n=1 Tax=Yoonia rhodophyticola TaxID=3137370 RepID=A0AAN0NLS2_9RHOB
MQILIAHESAAERGRISNRLSRHPGVSIPRAVPDLTQTYDFAEHQQPDCVILSGGLAAHPEFELLASLLSLLGIGCIVLAPGPAARNLPATVLLLRPDGLDNDLINTIADARSRCKQRAPSEQPAPRARQFGPERLILIGASTGGVDALLQIIGHFGEDCPPTLVVQHTGGSFAQSLIRLLNGATGATVLSATHGARLAPGHIYMAPDDRRHLQLAPGRTPQIVLSNDPPITGHRPSVDALFFSALPHAPNVAAAILTGMGRDGAEGIKALRSAGARTAGQDEATSVVYGMPRVAKQLGGVEKQFPIQKIGPALLRASEVRTHV